MGKSTNKIELTEALTETRTYFRAWHTLDEAAENFEVTKGTARARLDGMIAAGVKVESRPRVIEREPGQRGRNPLEYRVEATASAGKASKPQIGRAHV